MCHPIPRAASSQIRALRTRFAQRDRLPFAGALPESSTERALRDHGGQWRDAVFTPGVTLWAFLTQVICPVGCCRLVVTRLRCTTEVAWRRTTW